MEPNRQKSTKGAMAVAIDLDRTTSRPGNRKFRFQPWQTEKLEQLYLDVSKPTKDQREKLAVDLGVEARSVENWFETRRRPRNNPAGDVAATASRVRAREGDNNNDDDDDDDDVEIAKPVRKKAKVDEPAGEKTEDAADESAAKVTQA